VFLEESYFQGKNMPALYGNPIQLLRSLSGRIQDGWVLVEFDYSREKMVLRKGDSIMKAVLENGHIEWKLLTDPQQEVPGTDKFYVI